MDIRTSLLKPSNEELHTLTKFDATMIKLKYLKNHW